MKKSDKKSTVKSKSKKVKNPLKKYQVGGGVNIAPLTTSATPTTGFGSGNSGSSGFGSAPLGGDSYLSTPSYGSNTFNTLYGGSTPSFSSDNLTNVSDPSYGGLDSSLDTSLNAPRSLGDYYKDTQTAFGDKSNKPDILKSEYKTTALSKQDANLRKAKIAADTLSSIPGVNFIGEAMKSTKVDDPNKFYNRNVRNKLERYNKKIKGAKTTSAGLSTAATALGTASGAMALTGAGLPVAAILGLASAAAGIGAGISEGAAGGYSNKQEQFAAEYAEKVEDRKRDILRTDEQRKKNAAMNAQQYYNVPTAKTGGLMKYMAGGYTKVTGPSHENGGVPMDLDEDGVIDSELEGDEIIEELPEEGLATMKQGGSVPKKYIWSDHLKTGGISFAKKFEKLRKGGARPGDVEKLRIEQEIAAKRDPSKLYAKYGGIMKYGYGGKMEYMKEGGKLPKEVLESRLESHMSEGEAQNYLSEYKGGGLWANIHAKRKRIAAGSGEKMRKPGSEGAPTAKALRESKRDGGLMKYQGGGGVPPTTPPTQKRVSRTGAGKFLAEYGAPMANVVGEAANIGMNLSQKYTPVAPVTARDVKAEQVFIDRAKDKRVGARESELVAAKRAIQQKIGSGQGQLNAARMISLRAQEEAAQNVYDINRQASATEQQLNQQARLEADMANQRKDLVTSESSRAESLRKQSFENMRKKYIGSAASGLGNQLAQGMYTKEYINATLPEGVDPYALKPKAISDQMKKTDPATGKKYTYADAINAVLIQYNLENP